MRRNRVNIQKMLIIIVVCITGIFLSATSVAQDGMISHWKFDESSGSTAYDAVGNNDGTLTNGPQWKQ